MREHQGVYLLPANDFFVRGERWSPSPLPRVICDRIRLEDCRLSAGLPRTNGNRIFREMCIFLSSAIFLPKIMLSLRIDMAKNYFKSYIWLLETLQSRGPLTLAQIRQLWRRSSVNELGSDLPARTFANHIEAIFDIFGIEIVCDRRDNTYRIVNEEDMDGTGIRSWMLDALCLNSLLNESAGMKDRIIFENVPSSHQFLSIVIQAIRDNQKLKVRYHGYRMDQERTFELEPYFIREYKRRWYLYGHKDYDKDFKPHMYALDRMKEVEILSDTFKVPEDLDAKAWFQSLYGVRKYEDMKNQQVLLKVYGKQVRYFRSLPLHSSQEEVETHKGFSVFSYNLAPDYDFKQDVLSFGDTIEVLEPMSLRNAMREHVAKLSELYGCI